MFLSFSVRIYLNFTLELKLNYIQHLICLIKFLAFKAQKPILFSCTYSVLFDSSVLEFFIGDFTFDHFIRSVTPPW